MRIVIAGDGDTGTHLAQTLSVENQDIVLLGSDLKHLDELDSSGNFMTSAGSALSADALMQCGIDEADLFVAVTHDENVNLLSSQIAKSLGAYRCVARIDSPELMDSRVVKKLHGTGIDALINPERLAAREIVHFIRNNWVREWLGLHSGKLIVAGVKLPPTSSLAGKQLRDTSSAPRIFHVSAIKRNDGIMIPRGDTTIMAGDTVYFSVLPENIDMLCDLCGCTQVNARRIMITGGGRVTENLLDEIANDYDITVIESDPARCRELASRFSKVIVVNTSANDVATLKEEGLDHCDIFLALTRSSETNIVSCMVAREHGVARTLARIEELQYMPEAESLSIDKMINKKLLNVGRIINVLLEEGSDEAQCMLLDGAEIIEIRARQGSKIVSAPLAQLTLPRELTIGGLIRGGNGLLADGSTRIRPGDHVMVFCHTGSLAKVERLFRK